MFLLIFTLISKGRPFVISLQTPTLPPQLPPTPNIYIIFGISIVKIYQPECQMTFSSLSNLFLHHGILRLEGVVISLIQLNAHIDSIKKVH